MGGGSGAPPAHTTPISCWLVPPEKPKAELSALVQKLASENGLPAFDVHITIIGDVLGEHCSSEAQAIERLQLLEHFFFATLDHARQSWALPSKVGCLSVLLSVGLSI